MNYQQLLNDMFAKCKPHRDSIFAFALVSFAILCFYIFNTHPPSDVPNTLFFGMWLLCFAIYSNHLVAHFMYGTLILWVWLYILLDMSQLHWQFVLGFCFAVLTFGLISTAKHSAVLYKQMQNDLEEELQEFVLESEHQLQSDILPTNMATSEQQ